MLDINLDNGVPVSSMKELGELLRHVRKSKKITQGSISGMADWGNRFVGEVEKGKPTVRAQMLFDLIGWLGMEIVIRRRK